MNLFVRDSSRGRLTFRRAFRAIFGAWAAILVIAAVVAALLFNERNAHYALVLDIGTSPVAVTGWMLIVGAVALAVVPPLLMTGSWMLLRHRRPDRAS